MGFRKRNAKRSDNRSSAKVIMGKPASQLSKEEKKILSARMAEIRSENGGKSTVQNTIPFLCMYQDGVCQVSENFFSLTVQFYDANYSIAEFDEQNNIFSKYCDVINLFDNTIRFQLTFENQNRSKAKLVKTVQIPEQDDDFNSIRKEYSEMLTDKLLKGSNGQSARKFLTFGIESTSYKAARAKLMSIKNDVIKGFKAFGVEAELLDGRQRLEALYYALNPYRNSPFLFDWGEMLRAGMDTKDFICPPSLKFNKADFEIGNAYGAVWGMNHRWYSGTSHPFYYIDNDTDTFFFMKGSTRHNRSFWGWDGTDAWFLVSPTDTHIWNSSLNDVCMYGYYEKYKWKTECKLYYNVKQNKTFDEVIADKLGSMSHSDERLQYYSLLIGTDGSASMYGNHQTLHNLLPGATIRDYSLKREFGYEMTGWNTDSDGLYQGIKVYCTNGDKLKAPFKGKITDVDTDDNKITIRKDDVEYWYDGTGGTERDTEVTIANAVLLSGFSEGDTVNDGQEFAKTTAGNVNFHIYIDTDGYGWDYIDPRLVLY